MAPSFRKILIANRGEIACRIIRTARRLGIATVAVYSQADRTARHVALADEAFFIGPAPARDSYLDSARIVEVARRAGAEAIHPGYGFLAENADFARACAEAGLAFIGPPATAIQAMGDKAAAKALMEEAGVPTLPGYHGEDQDPARLSQEALRIGYPVLIKPSAGGGGKGMKVAAAPEEFRAALASAKREAAGAFGDDRVLLETYLREPRHVEVQIFADTHANIVHLFDRDCSIQRRHQKIIEEAPAPGLSQELRAAMRHAAVTAARRIGYVGAGTIEFLVSRALQKFHFLEMNTRLQVEHPVTEMITGLDLVEWQIRVAEGAPLPLTQEKIVAKGHAIEARLYAEDPKLDFLPQSGTLKHLHFPAQDAHLRIDSGVAPGDTITPYYDPLIAKVVTYAEDRPAACEAMRRALAATRLVGVATNIGFLRAVVAHDAFQRGSLGTNFIERHSSEIIQPGGPASNESLAIAVIGHLVARAGAEGSADPWSPWNRQDAWRLNHEGEETICLREIKASGASEVKVTVGFLPGGWRLLLPDGTHIAHAAARLEPDGQIFADLDGHRVKAIFVDGEREFSVLGPDGTEHRFLRSKPGVVHGEPTDIAGSLTSPMPGRVAALLVEPGAKVEAGQPVLVIEAMKMEHMLHAPSAGIVEEFKFGPGEQVDEGALLVTFQAKES